MEIRENERNKMSREEKIEMEKKIGNELGIKLKNDYILGGINPDNVLINAIEKCYGHRVSDLKLIKLIESSPIVMK